MSPRARGMEVAVAFVVLLAGLGQAQEIRTLSVGACVLSVAFSPDGKTIATGDADQSIKVWDVGSGDLLRTLVGHATEEYWRMGIGALAFSPDGGVLAAGYDDGAVELWNANSWVRLRTLTESVRGGYEMVRSVGFSPDGRYLASWRGDKLATQGKCANSLTLWNVATATAIAIFPGNQETTSWSAGAFSPNGKTLASGSSEGIMLWDVASGAGRRASPADVDGVFSVAFSPDSQTLASGGEKILLWDVAGGTLRTNLHVDPTKPVYSVAFSPDGRFLVSGGFDQVVRVWDVCSGAAVAAMTGHADSVRSVAFSPDGRMLASGGFDRMVKLWNWDSSRYVAGPEETQWLFPVALGQYGLQFPYGFWGGEQGK